MGIKENFTQAVKELTGAGKDGDKNKSSQVEDLRRALEAAETPVVAPLAEPLPPIEPVTEEIPPLIVDDNGNGNSAPYYAPKASHAGLDVNIQELRQTADPVSLGAQSEPSPVSSPFAQTLPGQAPIAGHDFPRSEPSPVSSPFAMSPAIAQAMGEAPDMAEELTVISKNTVVEGNIRSFANMDIEGNIRGDIETTKNIELNGKVIGNLTCNNAQMLTSQIQGNIRMKGNILMGRDTLLIGDLVSTYAKVNGKVKGNLEIGGKAELKSDAVIFGDISASTITVDDGAIIQGYVSTTFLNKEESRNIFPDAISIAE
jgi:cytoskeletal protein CcmA (bactofilin family)